MKGEVKGLLYQIERGHIVLLKAQNLQGEQKRYFIQAQEQALDEARMLLIELCGPKAMQYIAWSIQWADVSYRLNQTLERKRRHISKLKMLYMPTMLMESVRSA